MNDIDQIIDAFKTAGDVQRAADMKRYMRNLFDFFGVKAPIRRGLSNEFVRNVKKKSIDEVLECTNALWSQQERECQYVGLDLLIAVKRRLEPRHIETIQSYITRKSWWDTVDGLATHAIGYLFWQHPELRSLYVPIWLEDENIWLNRTCILFQLSYKDKTDFDLLSHVIMTLKEKDEFFIQKAIGWSLRQYSKVRPEPVQSFISANQLSALAVREGSKYLNQ